MLQITTSIKSGPGGNNAKSSEVRKRFLEAYERSFGNVDQSCRCAGISRQTYYRWLRSKTSVNLQFQRRVKQIRPRELLIDLAETALMKLVDEGNLKATIYLLRTRGEGRGWGKSEPAAQIEITSQDGKVNGVKNIFNLWRKENPLATLREQRIWLHRLSLLADIPMPDLSQLDSLD